MARYAYLDSSAIVKFVWPEDESDALERRVLEYEGLLSSRLSDAEVRRAIARNQKLRLLQQAKEVFEAIVFVDVTRAILNRAAALTPPVLRTLDAIHLATALGLNIADLDFITYDVRLARAARGHGLTVPIQPKATR